MYLNIYILSPREGKKRERESEQQCRDSVFNLMLLQDANYFSASNSEQTSLLAQFYFNIIWILL